MPENDCNSNSQNCPNKECLTKLRKNDVQERSKKVLEALASKPLNYTEVVKQSGLNSRYVKHCLDFLVSRKKVDRVPEDCKGARGRPRVFYSICSQTNQLQVKSSSNKKIGSAVNSQSKLPSTVAVEVPFSKLKSACKHQKGGNCLEKKMQKSLPKCMLSRCPLKVNIKLVNEG